MQPIPKQFDFKVHGSYYKVGRFGFVYIWLETWWKKSNKSLDDVLWPQPFTGDLRSK